MIHWLFSEGPGLLQALLLPLCGASVILTIMLLVAAGPGVRREERERDTLGRALLRLLTHGLMSLALVGAGTTLMAGSALVEQAGRDLNTTFIDDLIGESWMEQLVGPPGYDPNRLLLYAAGLLGLVVIANQVLSMQTRPGSGARESLDRLRRPVSGRGTAGSAHFCTRREYRRFAQKQDADSIAILGAFWGQGQGSHFRRLDAGKGQFCLSGEDLARGIVTIGAAGSGKTQAIILPVIADRMRLGHGLIVADPQGELSPIIIEMTKVTGHRLIVHDPTQSDSPRYNLASGISNTSDARSIAEVLIPSSGSGPANKFWNESAAALLAACLLRFRNLGDIYSNLSHMEALALKLEAEDDDAQMLAGSFIASVNSDSRLATNILATLSTALTGWADQIVRKSTEQADFSTDSLMKEPTVIILSCPGRMRDVYAPYLGAVLKKMMLDLDSIGEANHGPLPRPVAVVMDEFPALGRLDSLVSQVNLVRKRRISILLAAQTIGQFELIYGKNGTTALLTGLATQIIFGGCDHETAHCYSAMSGITTERSLSRSQSFSRRQEINPDEDNEGDMRATYSYGLQERTRALLTPDEIQTPPRGNSIIFARYTGSNHAMQTVILAQPTRFYERSDWQRALKRAARQAPRRDTRPSSNGNSASTAIPRQNARKGQTETVTVVNRSDKGYRNKS